MATVIKSIDLSSFKSHSSSPQACRPWSIFSTSPRVVAVYCATLSSFGVAFSDITAFFQCTLRCSFLISPSILKTILIFITRVPLQPPAIISLLCRHGKRLLVRSVTDSSLRSISKFISSSLVPFKLYPSRLCCPFGPTPVQCISQVSSKSWSVQKYHSSSPLLCRS